MGIRRLLPAARMALGLSSLTVSILFAAQALRLIPDRNAAIVDGRRALCEAMAIHLSSAAQRGDLPMLRASTLAVVERDSNIISAQVRTADGKLLVESRPKSAIDDSSAGSSLLAGDVHVPIALGNELWGTLQLRFRAPPPAAYVAFTDDGLIELAGFVAISSFVFFYLFLRRALPDTAVASPGEMSQRVRLTLDTMVEGVLLLDQEDRIVLANQAFASMVGRNPESLEGEPISALSWRETNGRNSIAEAPWKRAREEAAPRMNCLMELRGVGPARMLSVNCTPVLGNSGGSRGVLATLHDLTEVNRRNEQLKRLISRLRHSRQEIRTRALQQAAVAELGQRALEAGTLSRLMNETVQLTAQTMRMEYCELLELTPGSSKMLLRANVGGRAGSESMVMIDADVESTAGFALLTRAPVIVEDQTTEARFCGRRELQELGMVSSISVAVPGPLSSFGVLSVHTSRRRNFTDDDVHFLQSIANVLAATVERRAAEAALREAHDLLETRVHERTSDLQSVNNRLKREVTERKLAEAALRISEQSFRTLFESSADAIFVEDLNGQLLDLNPAACRLHHAEATQLLGKNVLELAPPERRSQVARDLAMLTSGQCKDTESVLYTADGREVAVSISASRINYHGRPAALLHVRDITERRRLEKEILEISGREQRRIGQDLHDGLGQHLTGIAFISKSLEQKLNQKGLAETSDASLVVELVNQAISQTRSLARGLQPVELESNGLASALEDLAANVQRMCKIDCQFAGDDEILIEDNTVATHLYRIAQEAVNNALKHGQAKSINISLESDQDKIVLKVGDDGVGLGNHPDGYQGMGLRIMNYRARIIHATFDIRPNPTGGTLIVCTL